MKDDWFVAKNASEYVATKIIVGSRPFNEQIMLKKRMNDIRESFIKRFGYQRGNKLIKEIDSWGGI